MKALILVDLQNDFLPGGALAVPDGDAVVDVANRLMPEFDLVVATRDCHPADHRSFASQHPRHRVGELIELDGYPQVLWPDHCVAGTPGADFAPRLDVSHVDRVFLKGVDPQVDSYRGFYDNRGQRDTGLADYLRQRGVTEVYLLGLATDYCVKFTALDAVRLGFVTHVIEDGCRGVELEAGDVDRAWQDMRRAEVDILRSESVRPGGGQAN